MSTLNVTPRIEGGAKAKQLRKEGSVPISLIGRDHKPLLASASLVDVRKALSHPDSHGRVNVQIGGEKATKAVVKNVEHDAIKHLILAVTLQVVAEDDMIKADVPITMHGTPAILDSVSNAMLSQAADHIKVRGKVSALPDHIEVDVTNIEIGGNISAGDIKLPDGVELLSAPDTTLFVLNMLRVAAESTDTAAEVAPAAAPAE